jgi:hypothetical protein
MRSSLRFFTEDEQAFYREQGFENIPPSLSDCRAAKNKNGTHGGSGGQRECSRRMLGKRP